MGVYLGMNPVPANPSRGFGRWLAVLALLLLVAGCAAGGGGGSFSGGGSGLNARADSASARTSAAESAPASVQQRPGLGTEFGEERESRVRLSRFVRADGNRPLATTAVYYDDASGVRAADDRGDRSFAEPPPSARGLIELTLRDGESGFALPTRTAGGRRLVTGRPGKRYVVELRNRTDARLEIVLSVDGLDAIDGRPAGYGKPGYILAPGGRVRVEGFRQSLDTVAAFRFAAVRDSYAAQRYGDTRNVGVIGAAVFGERGRLPFGGGRDEETERRRRADPFPGQGGGRFAEPPPRRY